VTPCKPVLPGRDLPIIHYAANQPDYQSLPAYQTNSGISITRWRCNWRDRLRVLFWGDVYLCQMTFHQPLQPVRLQTAVPEIQDGELRA
jgi:hypothetical protein